MRRQTSGRRAGSWVYKGDITAYKDGGEKPGGPVEAPANTNTADRSACCLFPLAG